MLRLYIRFNNSSNTVFHCLPITSKRAIINLCSLQLVNIFTTNVFTFNVYSSAIVACRLFHGVECYAVFLISIFLPFNMTFLGLERIFQQTTDFIRVILEVFSFGEFPVNLQQYSKINLLFLRSKKYFNTANLLTRDTHTLLGTIHMKH